MDFLNQATGQIRELFVSMTPAARVTALLLVGVIAVSLGYLFQHHSAGPDDYLFNGEFLPASDIDRAEAAIAQAGLNDYERVGNRLRVPRGRKAEYLAAVAEAGALPPNFHSLLEDALDLGPFVDPETRRQRMKAAREQQLSMIIRAMHGIEEAQVIYDMREPRGLSKTGQVTATVSVQPTPGEAIDAKRMKMIKKAVAGAIVGLTLEKVMVINLGDGTYLGDGDVLGEFDDPYFQTRIAYERYMKSNIEDLLSYIPGIRVRVTAELDDVLESTTRTITPDGETAPLRENSQDSESKRTHTDVGGQVGVTAQGPSRSNEQLSNEKVTDTTIDGTRETENLVGTKDQFLRESGLVPKHVRAGIAIPNNYLLDVWRERQSRKGEDPNGPLPDDIDTQLEVVKIEIVQNIEEVIVPLFPKEIAKNPFPNVRITFFETIRPDPIEAPSTAGQALAWAGQNFNTMTMAVIALVSLFMLRSMVKSVPPSDPVVAFGTPTLSLHQGDTESESAAGEEPDEEEERRPRLKLKKGHSLKDDLTEIVREDPDAAAAILRGWISNAG
ncbi:MAG: hypothetical protein IH898_01295 [Planctomycetes bacterium]|nr:hypothetical protein [Planctomycetota bacterium]